MSLYYQGRLATEMKDFAKAEDFYRRAAIEDPTFFDASAALAKLYIENKPDQTRAKLWACQTVHTDPTGPTPGAARAGLYHVRCWTEALDFAHRAEMIDGVNPARSTASRAAPCCAANTRTAAQFLRKYLALPPGAFSH